MFTRCEPCRYFTQVTFQALSMDVKLSIKILLIFCIITGCINAEDHGSIKSKSNIDSFPSSCTLSNKNVRKPLRGRIFSRKYFDKKAMEGCIDYSGLSSVKIINSESQSGAKHAMPVTQRYLIQLSQQLSVKLTNLNMRLDMYADRLYSYPLDIVLVLHSFSGYTWTLNVASLASSVKTKKVSSLKILFTHKDSKLALEQLRLPKWRIVVDYATPKTENVKSFQQITRWVEDVLLRKPLALTVNFPSKFSRDPEKSLDFDFVNTLDLTILPGSFDATGKRKVCNQRNISSSDLSQWITGTMDVNIDDGFTSCHTRNVWAPYEKSGIGSVSKTKSMLKSKRVNLLQSLEFPLDLVKDLKSGDELVVRLRVQTAPTTKDGNDTTLLVILNKSPALKFFMDLRGLNGKLIIHTNMNQSINFHTETESHQIEVDAVETSPEGFLERVMRRYDPDGINSSTWHIERIRFSRIPPFPRVSPVIYLDISLSRRPLKLCDMENLVVLQCFNTEDLVISLNAKTFQNVGLKREWVLLGKERCNFSESEDGKWVRKFLLHSKDRKCGTQRRNIGETVRLSNQIYIDCQPAMSKGLSSYPLNVHCTYATSSTEDFPRIDGNPSQPDNDKHLSLWSTWDGNDYAGPRLSIGAKRHFGDQLNDELKLELFEDEKLSNKIVYHFSDVKSGQTLYARLQPIDQTVNYGLMVRDCYLSNTLNENNPLGYPRQYLIIKGCDMGVSFQWKVAESYRVKIFSFVTPRLSFFSMSPYVYLHCNVQSCNYMNPGDRIKGLPRCWNQNFLCNVPETPATTHLVSVPLRNADNKDDNKEIADNGKTERNSKSVIKTVPLWGAVVIAAIAFLLGILFTCIMWFVHNHSGGHCDVGDRILNRRRNSHDRRRSGRGRCYGNKEVNSRKLIPTRSAQCRQSCLHRMMPHTYLEDGTVITEDAPDDNVARLLVARGVVDGVNMQGYSFNDGKGENALYDSTSPNSSRVKNSHSISCTVCGEGSSSGFGTGNCSSCSAQTCSLVDENEPTRHLPQKIRPPATSDYQQPQEEQLYSQFASA